MFDINTLSSFVVFWEEYDFSANALTYGWLISNDWCLLTLFNRLQIALDTFYLGFGAIYFTWVTN